MAISDDHSPCIATAIENWTNSEVTRGPFMYSLNFPFFFLLLNLGGWSFVFFARWHHFVTVRNVWQFSAVVFRNISKKKRNAFQESMLLVVMKWSDKNIGESKHAESPTSWDNVSYLVNFQFKLISSGYPVLTSWQVRERFVFSIILISCGTP